ncbi:S49 family peptidase [Croceicoccus gelatinilyticus]|uniref:S49 family peptidase n=1 Tax=Croceicoccus gelatinilyticus TaxID=2835536 RepID=UPI001BCB2775|nr:S49 family peptidase [Croceicoccus gelatinilyticus]MBS7669343.1 S49 family peptidase [Croceicoccus gelatinilyticus]
MNRAYSRAGIIARLFNQPLAVLPQTAKVVLGAVGDRLDVSQLFVPTDGRALALGELEAMAADARVEIEARGGVDRRAGSVAAERLMFVHAGVAHVVIRGETVAENGIGPSSGFTGYDGIAASVESADNDPNVRGILLDIDSPGGEVAGLYECASILMARRGKKPMRAMIRGMGCSAAYALACCADEVTVHELGYAGSIGTIAMHADFSGALEKDGIKVTMFTGGAHKADGNPFEPLPEDVARDIQSRIDIATSRFVAHVAEARGIGEDAVRAQEARIYSGEAAVTAGLADKVMSWKDSMVEFEQLVNSPASSGSTAPSGARSARKETAMSTEATAPAADQQPETINAQVEAARAEGHAAGVTEGQTAERERIVALAEIDGGSKMSAGLTEAISAGTSAGDYAIAQAKAAKARTGAALEAAGKEAVQSGDLPETGASANPTAQPESNRGQAYAARKAAAKTPA